MPAKRCGSTSCSPTSAPAAISSARSRRGATRAGAVAYVGDFGVHGSYDAWVAAGSPTTVEQARVRVEELLADQVSLPYSDDQAAALAALQRRADAAT